jgi:hypothetical protein
MYFWELKSGQAPNLHKKMETHGQDRGSIQTSLWGDISRLSSGLAVLRRRIPPPG